MAIPKPGAEMRVLSSWAEAPVLVSACLLGEPTRFDGRSAPNEEVLRLAREREVIPVCPETLGGLSVPRSPAEIESGDGGSVLDGKARVIRCDGVDVTEAYMRGAQRVLEFARQHGAREAWLKERSPACGVKTIKRGENAVPGQGVCAALLARSGVRVIGF